MFGLFYYIARLNDSPKDKELREQVQKKIADKWEEVAIELGLDDSDDDGAMETKLDKIRNKYKDNPNMAAYNVLKFWAKEKKTKPNWSTLIEAIKVVGLQEVAGSILNFLSKSSKSVYSLLITDLIKITPYT